MYEEMGCFDPNPMAEDEFSQSLPNKHEFSYHHQEPSMELEFEKQLAFNNNNHLIQDPNQYDHLSLSNWSGQDHMSFSSSQQTPDLLNLFHLPRSISFDNANTTTDPTSTSADMYDSLFHLNLPPQPPLFRDLFQSIPHGYSLPASRSVFGDDSGVTYQDEGDRGVFEFTRGPPGKITTTTTTKHFATERQRRQHLNGKYADLRNLVPNPTKNDRASVVGDAIEYMKELIRTVKELKLLVDKKRCGRERSKRHKTEQDDVESCNMKPLAVDPDSYNGSLRSSWLQRKSKDTEVDVRIVDDEVTIKLVQRKKIDCLLFVSKIFDDLHLDLHHVVGGHIGDYSSFLFNTKIFEGSSVYAGSIANKLIDVMDKQYAAVPPTTTY